MLAEVVWELHNLDTDVVEAYVLARASLDLPPSPYASEDEVICGCLRSAVEGHYFRNGTLRSFYGGFYQSARILNIPAKKLATAVQSSRRRS